MCRTLSHLNLSLNVVAFRVLLLYTPSHCTLCIHSICLCDCIVSIKPSKQQLQLKDMKERLTCTYLWAQRILQQEGDRFRSQTEGGGFSFRCPSLSPPAEAQLHHLWTHSHSWEHVQLVKPYLPEPVNLFAVFGVMSVDGVFLPVSQIDLLHPTQHQLQHKYFKCSERSLITGHKLLPTGNLQKMS